MNNDFWELVDEHQIEIPDLMQICSAPIKVLLAWRTHGAPDSAIDSLKNFLQSLQGDR